MPRIEVSPGTKSGATLNIFDTTAATTTEADGSLDGTATGRQCSPGQSLRRRRQASYRCEPLASGHRDPWQPWRPERLSDKQIEGAAVAARHLLDLGMAPRFDIATLRQLWKAGHHQLVDELRVAP